MRRLGTAILLCCGLAACGSPAGNDAASPPVRQTCVLGVPLPFSGPLASYGIGFREGIELAVAEMNAQLESAGSPVRFRGAAVDTEGTPAGAARAAQLLVETSGARVLVGPLSTSEVLAVKSFVDARRVVVVAPASSGLAAAIPDDFIFRPMHPPDSYAGQAMAAIAAQRGYRGVALLHLDDSFGSGLAGAFRERFEKSGEGRQVILLRFAPDQADLSGEVGRLRAEVARLKAAGPTAVLFVGFLGDMQKVLRHAQVDSVLGGVDWLGNENLKSDELLADGGQAAFLARVRFTCVSLSGSRNPNTAAFEEAYQSRYGRRPGPFTNYAYDAAYIAMLSVLAAGNDGEAVRRILPFISGRYVGTQAQALLDENGDQAIAELGIYQVAADGSGFAETGRYDGAAGRIRGQ